METQAFVNAGFEVFKFLDGFVLNDAFFEAKGCVEFGVQFSLGFGVFCEVVGYAA